MYIGRMIGISGTLICSKILIELYLIAVVNFGEIRRAQLNKFTLLTSTLGPWVFSDIWRSIQMLKKESLMRKAAGSYRTYLSPVKLQPWFISLQWKTCLWTQPRPWFLRLQWKTTLGQNILIILFLNLLFRARQHLRSLEPVMNNFLWLW